MRGFTKTPRKSVKFSQCGEDLTYTVHPLNALFLPMVRELIPITEEMGADAKLHVIERRVLVMVAESLRPTEDGIPPHPSPTASPEEWLAYCDDLADLFHGAGLSIAAINRLARAVDELEQDALQQLETVGNG